MNILKQRIDILECLICGKPIINATNFKCVEDANISINKIWICKKHPFPDEVDWLGIISAIASGMV